MGPKELDIKLEEFEARLTMLNRELEELVKTAKDIEHRATLILDSYKKWLPVSGVTQSMTSLFTRDAQAARQQ